MKDKHGTCLIDPLLPLVIFRRSLFVIFLSESSYCLFIIGLHSLIVCFGILLDHIVAMRGCIAEITKEGHVLLFSNRHLDLLLNDDLLPRDTFHTSSQAIVANLNRAIIVDQDIARF